MRETSALFLSFCGFKPNVVDSLIWLNPRRQTMTDFGQELGSLDFENIIGGPLTAVVEAQAHAAETSIEFINEVGLTFEDGRITPIKTVFSYQKESTDEQGVTRSRTHNIEVPVLAIVPIPYMVFNDVWLNFNVNLNSVENRSHNSFTGGSIAGRGRFGGFSFSGSVAASRQKRDTGTVSKTYAMGVKIHAVQDEMPEGMERVLNILEQVAKAEVKPYNAVKQISGLAVRYAVCTGIEYGATVTSCLGTSTEETDTVQQKRSTSSPT